MGTPGPGCPSLLGPPDPFPAPATPGHTRHVLPHLGRRSLTFSMTPTTLQPLSCSRAELSVRMGRSLRLLKPCNGRREPRCGLRVTASSPGGRQGLSLPGDQWPQRAGPGCGQTPTSLRQTEQRSWPRSRVAGHPLISAPTQPSFQALGVLRNPLLRAPTTGGRSSQGWGNNPGNRPQRPRQAQVPALGEASYKVHQT